MDETVIVNILVGCLAILGSIASVVVPFLIICWLIKKYKKRNAEANYRDGRTRRLRPFDSQNGNTYYDEDNGESYYVTDDGRVISQKSGKVYYRQKS